MIVAIYVNVWRVMPVALLSVASLTAHASAQCLQWKQDMISAGQVGATSGWLSNAQQACTAVTNLCAANPLSCGFNSSSYSFRNWDGVVQPVAWPGFQCLIHYQIKGVQFPDWTDFTSTNGMVNRQHPDCKVFTSLTSEGSQCGASCNGVAHPIDPADGSVYDTAEDLGTSAGIPLFKRFYDSGDQGTSSMNTAWRHSYSRRILPVKSTSAQKGYLSNASNSSLYNDEASACISGFAELKSRVSTWAGAAATYSNGRCNLAVGTTSIGMLPLYYTATPTPAPGSTLTIAYQATRDDGQVISFLANGSSADAPPGVGMKLQVTASGYSLTDMKDAVENYDVSGRLLSIARRGGVIETMGYDASDRLSTVTSSFGHSIILTYDGQGRLSTVTRH
jgi:YD repeat-containing protein